MKRTLVAGWCTKWTYYHQHIGSSTNSVSCWLHGRFMALALTCESSSTPALTMSQATLKGQVGMWCNLQLLLLGLPVAPDLNAALPFAGSSTGIGCICLHLPADQSLLQEKERLMPFGDHSGSFQIGAEAAQCHANHWASQQMACPPASKRTFPGTLSDSSAHVQDAALMGQHAAGTARGGSSCCELRTVAVALRWDT